jgi:hypothetical protein
MPMIDVINGEVRFYLAARSRRFGRRAMASLDAFYRYVIASMPTAPPITTPKLP